MLSTRRLHLALRRYDEVRRSIPTIADAGQLRVTFEDYGPAELSDTTLRMICEEVAAKRTDEIAVAEQELLAACKELSHA